MIDTIVNRCLRPLKKEVLTNLRSVGYHRSANWKVTSKTTPKRGSDEFQKRFVAFHDNEAWGLRVTGKDGILDSVKVELPCVIYPTNGYMLVSQAEIDRAIETVHRAIDEIAERGHPWTDTVRLDIAMNLPLPPDLLLNALRSSRVLGLHAWPELFEDLDMDTQITTPQSLSWKGKESRFSIYNKTNQVCKKYRGNVYNEANACSRIEWQLKSKNAIVKFLGDTTGGAIASLDFFHLYRCIRRLLLKLPSSKALTTKCTMKTLLAANVKGGFKHEGVPVMEWYRQSASPSTFARSSREIANQTMAHVGIDWSKILPPHAPPEMLHVREDGKLLPAYDPSWGTRQRIIREGDCYGLTEACDPPANPLSQ